MDTEVMKTLPELSVTYVVQALLWSALVALAIFCVFLPLACIYWMSMALRRIGSAILSSWRSFDSGGLCSLPTQNKPSELLDSEAGKAGDALAHQTIYSPFHERWWKARGGHDKCTVCNS